MKKNTITESTLFLAVLTAVGGFINAYSFVVREGFLPNGMTGNMTKVGIQIAQGNLSGAFVFAAPILSAISGAVFCEYIKKSVHSPQFNLFLEGLGFFLLAVFPETVPDLFYNAFLCFLVGYQLCLFRASRFGAYNTTICTGNLRSVGQYCYEFFSERNLVSALKMMKYSLLVGSFSAGSMVGYRCSVAWGKTAALAACAVVICLMAAVRIGDQPGHSRI